MALTLKRAAVTVSRNELALGEGAFACSLASRGEEQKALPRSSPCARVARSLDPCAPEYWNWIAQIRHWRVHARAAGESAGCGRTRKGHEFARALNACSPFLLTRPRPPSLPSPNARTLTGPPHDGPGPHGRRSPRRGGEFWSACVCSGRGRRRPRQFSLSRAHTPDRSLLLLFRQPQDKAAVLADVRSIISEQLGTELDKVRVRDRRDRRDHGGRDRSIGR